MKHYPTFSVSRTQSVLWFLLRLELQSRLFTPKLAGMMPKPLSLDCRLQAEYCLDAPDIIPAGGCHWEWADVDLGAAVPLTIDREPEEP